tara:strand:+ start:738 stop:854 length:117 start_codon:yes stop_codon:yes gene_type:complete
MHLGPSAFGLAAFFVSLAADHNGFTQSQLEHGQDATLA